MSTSSDQQRPEAAAAAHGGRIQLSASVEDARSTRLAKLALLLPEADARSNQAIILDQKDGTYYVGMIGHPNFVNEKNVTRIISATTGDPYVTVEARPIQPEEFEALFETAYASEFAAIARVGEAEPHRAVSWSDINPQSAGGAGGRDEPAVESATGFTVFVEHVLREGARRGASDVHFKPGPKHGGIYLEINNELYPYSENVPKAEHEKVIRTLADMAGVNEYELPYGNKDSSIQMMLPAAGRADALSTMRLNAVPALDGIDVTVRYLNQTFRDFHEMGHEPEQTELFIKKAQLHHGINIVTGTTGSGKSTLLEAILRRATADRKKNTINIGEPIEFEDHWRTQIPITKDYQWEMALEAALRKNPKIIVLGEIRNEEVARIAFRAAYTGHLILTTLHTNDVASTFSRLANLGIPAYDQGELIRSITSQALVRVLCESCKQPDPRAQLIAENIAEKVFPNRPDIKEAIRQHQSSETPFFMVGRGKGVAEDKVGCPLCNFTGYSGRTAIAEALDMTPDISTMIGLGMRGEQAVEFAINSYGMITLAEAAARKLLMGATSFSEVEQWLSPPPMKRAGSPRYATAAAGVRQPPTYAHHAAEAQDDDTVIEAEYSPVEEAA
ncbi:MAG: GspE/PulE family protein [Pyrinomonadaceae bacterium]